MKRLETRVAVLEARTAIGEQLSTERNDALGRVFSALRAVLLAEYPLSSRTNYSRYYVNQKWTYVMSFEELISELHRRIITGTLTADDRRVFDALPADELNKAGLTSYDAVHIYARIFAAY